MAPPPIAKRPNSNKHIQVMKTTFAYTAQRPDELSFAEDEVIYVLNKENPDWWLCKINDKQGLVPMGENSVQIDNPLHEAAKRGNIAFCSELLKEGVSPNGLDKAGNSPLHWGARGGHVEIVKMLLDKQAVIDVQNKMGDTPLHLASWGGHSNVLQILLDYAADKTVRNNEGQTPLDVAKGDDCAALLMKMLAHGSSNYLANLQASSDEDE